MCEKPHWSCLYILMSQVSSRTLLFLNCERTPLSENRVEPVAHWDATSIFIALRGVAYSRFQTLVHVVCTVLRVLVWQSLSGLFWMTLMKLKTSIRYLGLTMLSLNFRLELCGDRGNMLDSRPMLYVWIFFKSHFNWCQLTLSSIFILNNEDALSIWRVGCHWHESLIFRYWSYLSRIPSKQSSRGNY
jgi:hypothetical protein